MAFTVAWELSPERVARYTIRAAESDAGFRQQVNRFRRGLWTWFAGVAIVLLVVQAVILRWGLAPLRRVADEVTNIENGRQAELAGPYPRELEAAHAKSECAIAQQPCPSRALSQRTGGSGA